MRWSGRPTALLLLLHVLALARGHRVSPPPQGMYWTEAATDDTSVAATTQITLYPGPHIDPRIPPLTFNLTISPSSSSSSLPELDSDCPPGKVELTLNNHTLAPPHTNATETSSTPLRIASLEQNGDGSPEHAVDVLVKWRLACSRPDLASNAGGDGDSQRRIGPARNSAVASTGTRNTAAAVLRSQEQGLSRSQARGQDQKEKKKKKKKDLGLLPHVLHFEIAPVGLGGRPDAAAATTTTTPDTENDPGNTIGFAVFFFLERAVGDGENRVDIVGVEGADGMVLPVLSADGGAGTGWGDPARQLTAELEEMRERIREMERALEEERERWLTEGGGLVAAEGEEDWGLWRMMVKKMGYAAEAVFGFGRGGGGGGGSAGRPGQNDGAEERSDSGVLGPLQQPLAALILLAPILALLLLRLVAALVLGKGTADTRSLELLVTEVEARQTWGGLYPGEQRSRPCWRRVCGRIRELGGSFRVKISLVRRDQIRLGQESVDGHGYPDEKRAWRYQDFGLMEEGAYETRKGDERRSEDEADCENAVERGLEAESGSETEDAGKINGHDDSRSEAHGGGGDEVSSMAEEFASFRAALDLIDDIVAAGRR